MKEAVVGRGLENTAQVQEMVRRLLKLQVAPGKDAAGALGLAISHAHAAVSFSRLSRQTGLERRQHALYHGGRADRAAGSPRRVTETESGCCGGSRRG